MLGKIKNIWRSRQATARAWALLDKLRKVDTLAPTAHTRILMAELWLRTQEYRSYSVAAFGDPDIRSTLNEDEALRHRAQLQEFDQLRLNILRALPWPEIASHIEHLSPVAAQVLRSSPEPGLQPIPDSITDPAQRAQLESIRQRTAELQGQRAEMESLAATIKAGRRE